MRTVEMINVGEKEDVKRYAQAYGKLYLKRETIEKIQRNETKKGDPLTMGEITSILAAKQTPVLMPMCHQIPLSKVKTKFDVKEDYIEGFTEVFTYAKTGVEMEALMGVTTALLNVLDMVKYLEKDDDGQYPVARIDEVRVVKKVKE